MAAEAQAITGLILAGGQGSRLGGADKGLHPFRGRPLVAHTIERLAPQVSTLLISANRNQDTYAAFGHPVLTDRLPGHAGPLAGLDAGLAACTTPLLLTAPCDSPFLPADLSARLLAGLGAHPAAYACIGDDEHPVFALLRREVHANLSAYLAGGGRKMREWMRRVDAVAVDFPDPEAFRNFNTAESFLPPTDNYETQ